MVNSSLSRRRFAVLGTTLIAAAGSRAGNAEADDPAPGCSFDTDAQARSAYRRLSAYRPSTGEVGRHETNMRVAIQAAKANPAFPFGAAVVDESDDAATATGVSDGVITSTRHGEMVAIDNYVARNGHGRWGDTTLYSTGEPCAMCMGAIAWAGIPRVVWGSSVATIRASGIVQIDVCALELAARSHEVYQPQYCIGGIMSGETDQMFTNRLR